ncbi:hypothetical protein ERJ75_001308800 [Trypanosoma vivax]|nr:hypothetical protein ERJ75_001308800 [Trypanosoma vivax]
MLEICNARFTDLAPLKNLPALKSMRAMQCSLLHDGSAYASRMEALEELVLSSFCVRNRGDFDDLLNLREGLRCAGAIDAAHVLCAYKGSPRLRKVLLSCVEVRDLSSLLGFEALEEVELNGIKVLEGFGALGRHTTLRKLEVRQIPLTQDSLCGLWGSRSLVHLALEIPFSSGVQYDVSPLGNVVTLQVLRIWRSKQHQIPLWKEKPAQQVLAGLHVIGQLPHLMELSLSDYEILGDTVFELGASKTIARLSLHSMCSEHYASSLSCAQKKKESEKFTALSNLESLEELTIRDCQYFQVDAEFGYLPNLRVLKLHSYVDMDKALLRLSDSLTLTVLEVIAADGFGDLMPIASIRTLEEVKLFLFGLAKNSDALGYLPRLRKLEIFCADVLDNSLDERRCTRLYMKYFMLGYVTHYDTAPLARAKALEKVVLCNFEVCPILMPY